jgi:hypothetical protein
MTSLALVPFPNDFPNKGRFIEWDRAWNRIGYVDAPQYAGQQPIRYPEDATLLEIQFGGYSRELSR